MENKDIKKPEGFRVKNGRKSSQGEGNRRKPIEPVLPEAMEMIFFYSCPRCGRHVPRVNPTEATMAVCTGCGFSFPIVPVDEYTLQFVRIILSNGKAAVDSDFF